MGPSHRAFMVLTFVRTVVNVLSIGIVVVPVLSFQIRRDRPVFAS
jgi:hypothetical protein